MAISTAVEPLSEKKTLDKFFGIKSTIFSARFTAGSCVKSAKITCSNFSDFQARRANIKFKNKEGTHFAHTINGSGLAVGRTLIALIENNYNGTDSIKIPTCLQEYFGSDTLKTS